MKDIVKSTTIKITNIPHPEQLEQVEQNLNHLLGVNRVEGNYPKKQVRIDYNLRFVTYSALINKLSSIGHPASGGVFNAVKRRFIIFTEKNEIAGMGRPLTGRADLRGESIGKS